MNKTNIRAFRSEDVLSYVPHLLNFQPRNSLVLLSMKGPNLGATLRVDLPDTDSESQLAAFAETAASYLQADAEADGSLIVLYTDAPHQGDPGSFQYWPLSVFLEDLLAGAGTPVRGAWVVGPNSFRCLECRTSPCCPPQGHPSARITESHVNLELMMLGSSVAPTAEEAAAWARSRTRPDIGPVVRSSAQRLAANLRGQWEAAEVFARVLGGWDTALCNGTGQDAERLALLAASLDSPHVRDAVLVLTCLDSATAYHGAVAHGRVDLTATFPLELAAVLPAGECLPAAGRNVEACKAAFTDILVGRYPAPVHRERIIRAAELLARLHYLAEGEAKAAAGTMLAWLEWAQGHSSLAHEHLAVVLAETPGYRLAVLLEQYFGHGVLPAWLRTRPAASPEAPRQVA
ncbi:hypothetical protein D477_012975 [Arthrobacter crystallopoietes BAB-32]|uniref:DUF4192 domain-containing protein n=1 Tax=Arthrobacter crystallopoietes BAB-32 TaxID=1246476 RepID=N1V174_9MICC|nr:DUF4192 domain-containing protein [Arthrobacter crystallopoietes]EMY33807.1 hypothetical protein D477_012975 [Arthrobacter crystallopoietes BAB-32]